jgi:hypothetical protein
MKMQGEIDLSKKDNNSNTINASQKIEKPASDMAKSSKNHKRSQTEKDISGLSMTIGKQLNGFKDKNLFAQAYSYPNNIRIDGQESEEDIILLFRSHPITLFGKILLSFSLLLAALLVFPLASLAEVGVNSTVVVLSILLVLTSVTNFIYTVSYWFFNLNIITTERIIDVDFRNVSSYRVSETQLENIEDVSVSNVGFFASLFNYGSIFVQTSAEKREFEFTNIANPGKIQDILGDLTEIKQRGVKLNVKNRGK